MAQPCNADTSTNWADALNHSTQQRQATIDSTERLQATGEKRERDEAQSDSVEAAKMFRAVIEEIRALRARVFQAKAAVARSGTRADRADRQRHLSTTRSLLGDVYSRAEELHENILPLSLTPPVPDVIRWWQGGDRPKRHATRTSRTIQDTARGATCRAPGSSTVPNRLLRSSASCK